MVASILLFLLPAKLEDEGLIWTDNIVVSSSETLNSPCWWRCGWGVCVK